MGQPVAVTEKPSPSPDMVRFELNRALTGMGHERFAAAAEAFGPRPAAELARRLFATGQVDAVHIFSNVVTVGLKQGGSATGLSDVIRSLYQYWHPGMQPPTFDEPAAEEAADGGADSGGGSGAGDDVALSEAAKRVPGHLLERSRAARERWKAKRA